MDARCSILRYGFEPFPTPDVFKLAAAIRSRHAISQLFDLIKRQRDMNVDRPEPMTQTDDDRLRRCVRGIDAGEGHVGLKQLRTRLNQVKLTELIEESRRGRIYTKTTFIKTLKEDVGWTKKNLEYHCGEGSRWNAVAGNHDGLFCYILKSQTISRCLQVSISSSTKLACGIYTGSSTMNTPVVFSLLQKPSSLAS
ncbi:hypothetical protein EV126DRAFT_179018 [Verticillium dahliae]|nr:hypothetical protein EV126DRAFT_179018 [Verticillium dahliae]